MEAMEGFLDLARDGLEYCLWCGCESDDTAGRGRRRSRNLALEGAPSGTPEKAGKLTDGSGKGDRKFNDDPFGDAHR